MQGLEPSPPTPCPLAGVWLWQSRDQSLPFILQDCPSAPGCDLTGTSTESSGHPLHLSVEPAASPYVVGAPPCTGDWMPARWPPLL